MLAAIIKAFGAPDTLTLAEIPEPEAAPDEVLIRASAASINPIDCKSRRGNHKYILGRKFPIVLGWDVCGEVIATGSQCSRFRPGDKVYGRTSRPYGQTYAQVVASREQNLSFKPANLTDTEAAAVPMAALTALQALRDKGRIGAGQNVLILGGSGGVGHFAIQVAHQFGANVFASYSPRNRDAIEPLAPHQWIDYTRQELHSLPQRFDIIFDIVGTYSWLRCHKQLKTNGIYISSLPRPIILWHKLLAALSGKGKVKTLLMKAIQADLELMRLWIEEGKVRPLVTATFDLKDAAAAHRLFEEGKHAGKIVLTIT